jgi:hypothetical protein
LLVEGRLDIHIRRKRKGRFDPKRLDNVMLAALSWTAAGLRQCCVAP